MTRLCIQSCLGLWMTSRVTSRKKNISLSNSYSSLSANSHSEPNLSLLLISDSDTALKHSIDASNSCPKLRNFSKPIAEIAGHEHGSPLPLLPPGAVGYYLAKPSHSKVSQIWEAKVTVFLLKMLLNHFKRLGKKPKRNQAALNWHRSSSMRLSTSITKTVIIKI